MQLKKGDILYSTNEWGILRWQVISVTPSTKNYAEEVERLSFDILTDLKVR